MSNQSASLSSVNPNLTVADLSPKTPGTHDYQKDGVKAIINGLPSANKNDVIARMRSLNLSRNPRVTFPLPHYSTNHCWSGPACGNSELDQVRFGGGRPNFRLHAGVDLEAPLGTRVLAMADGIVLRVHYFYSDTSDVSVLHPGIGIVRYGEIDRKTVSLYSKEWQCVKQGQPLAHVGQRIENRVAAERTMLHLEFFSDETRVTDLDQGARNGLSTQPKGTKDHISFDRRNDNHDPTDLLQSAPINGEGGDFDKQRLLTLNMNPESCDVALRLLLSQARLFAGGRG